MRSWIIAGGILVAGAAACCAFLLYKHPLIGFATAMAAVLTFTWFVEKVDL